MLDYSKPFEPTPDQIAAMRREWNRVMGDVYDCGPECEEYVDTINEHISAERWLDVYRCLCDIGMDEVAIALRGGKIQ